MALFKFVQNSLRREYIAIGTNLKYFRKFSTENREVKELIVEKLQGLQKGITVMSFNNPKVKNALSKSFVYSILEAIEDLKSDPLTRIVILRSNVPGIFCAGADLKERLAMSNEDVMDFVKTLRKMTANIENIPVPVIAALDGAALGGGLEIALACDLRVAADLVKLGLVETRLAIIPGAGGTQRLPRIVSPSLAKELIFTARVFTGKEGQEMGIVNHSVQQNESKNAAYQKAIALAEEMLPNGPVALKMAKQAVDEGIQGSLLDGYKVEEKCYKTVVHTTDRIEGLKAFADKRKPKYEGR